MLFLHVGNNKLLLLLLLLLNCIRCNKRIIPVQKAVLSGRLGCMICISDYEPWLPEADLNSDLYDLKSIFFVFENNQKGE